MIRISILSFLLLLTFAPCLMAGEALVLTLQTIGDRVRSQNLELRAARHVIDEALGLHKQAGRLTNPDLEFATSIDDRNVERGMEVGFSQRFPLTNRLRLEKERSATAVEAARKEVALIENRLVAEARAGFVEALALRGRLELLQQQAEVVGKLADFTTEAAQRAEASAIDAGQARLEKARIDAECLRLEAEIQRAQVELKPLLGMSPQDSLVLGGTLPQVQHPTALAKAKSPEVALAELEVRKAEQLTAIERACRYDDVKVGLFVGVERTMDAPEPIEHEAMIALRVMLPLPLWDGNEGNIEAAQATTARRKGELEALEQRLSLEAATLRDEMLRWAKLATEIESQLLPQADQQTQLAEKAWRDGQVSLLSVMKSREQAIELAVARLDAIKNFHLARVHYLKILGDS